MWYANVDLLSDFLACRTWRITTRSLTVEQRRISSALWLATFSTKHCVSWSSVTWVIISDWLVRQVCRWVVKLLSLPRCLIFWLLVFLNIIFFFFLFCCYFLIFCWFRSIFFLFLNCFSVILSFFSFLFILPLLFRPVSHHHFVNHRFLAGWFID